MSGHLRSLSLLKRLPVNAKYSMLQNRSFYTRTFSPIKTIHSSMLTTNRHARMIPSVLFQKTQTKLWTSTVAPPKKKEEERIIYNNWLDHLPAKIAPYAFLTRIDKPIGTWLLFWPCGKK